MFYLMTSTSSPKFLRMDADALLRPVDRTRRNSGCDGQGGLHVLWNESVRDSSEVHVCLKQTPRDCYEVALESSYGADSEQRTSIRPLYPSLCVHASVCSVCWLQSYLPKLWHFDSSNRIQNSRLLWGII